MLAALLGVPRESSAHLVCMFSALYRTSGGQDSHQVGVSHVVSHTNMCRLPDPQTEAHASLDQGTSWSSAHTVVSHCKAASERREEVQTPRNRVKIILLY